MSNLFRSDPARAAELAVLIARCAPAAPAHKIAAVVVAMQAATRSAKRSAEHRCNYPTSEAQDTRMMRRDERAENKINAELAALCDGDGARPTINLGGDPRGACGKLRIPGQRGDGWGSGFAIY